MCYVVRMECNLDDIIKSSKKILLLSHVNPDGDTLGSMCAMYSMIQKRFKKKADMSIVIPELWRIVSENLGVEALKNHLGNYMTTDLQKRNLELVINPAYKALCQKLSETLIAGQS